MREKLTYANVMATMAMFLSLGAGAYAVGLGRNDVKSRHVADGTIKSRDVRDKGLYGRDIHEESLNSKQIREDRLDVTQFAKLESNSGFCDPSSETFVQCSTVNIDAEQTSQMLITGAGGQYSWGSAASSGICRISIDGEALGGSEAAPGEHSVRNTSLLAQNGFAITDVSPRLGRGGHTVALQCNELSGNTQLTTDLSVLLLDAM